MVEEATNTLSWLTNFKFDNSLGYLGIFSSVIWWGLVFFIVALVGLFAYFLITYRFKVIIFEKRGGGGVRVRRDSARKKITQGVVQYSLLKSRMIFSPPEETKQIFMSGKTDVLFLEQKDNFLYPMSVETMDGKLGFKNVPADVMAMAVLRMKKSVETYQANSKLMQMLPVAVSGISLMMVFVMFLIIINQIKNGINVDLTGEIPLKCTQVSVPTMTNPG